MKFKIGDKVIPNKNFDLNQYTQHSSVPIFMGIGTIKEVHETHIIAEFETSIDSILCKEEDRYSFCLKPFSFNLNELTKVNKKVQENLNEMFDSYKNGIELIKKSIKIGNKLSSNISLINDVTGLEPILESAGWNTSSLQC